MKTSFSKSSHPEFSGICQKVIDITNQSKVAGIKEQPLFNELLVVYPAFFNAVLRESHMKMGDSVQKLNMERITISRALRNMVQSIVKFSNNERQLAAQTIAKEWSKLEKLPATRDYDVLNTYMKKVLEMLNSENIKPHLQTLSLDDELADIEKAEQEFQTALLKQTAGNAALRKEGSATAHRPSVEKALGNYLKFITVMKAQSGYDMLYAKLNEAVKTARKTPLKSKKEEQETEK